MKHALFSRPRRIALSFLAVALVLGLSAVYFFKSPAPSHAASARVTPSIVYRGHRYIMTSSSQTPPTDKQCRQQFGFPCYSPQEMRRIYGVGDLINHGYIGTGQTIVIIDSFGSPTIAADLHTFDQGYNLPDPPSLKIYAPLGTKKFDPSNGTMVGWAEETTLDVEWAHSIAPGASIALMTSPVAETQGIQGMPQFLFLEQYALYHRLGKIISQSWATTENTLFGPGGRQVLTSFNNFYKQAAADGVTVFGSSGDSGVANPNVHGKTYPFPTINFPASDPYVTAVGGTSLTASTHGVYQSEVGWRGSGGGVSQYFKEPGWQVNNLPGSDQSILNGYRGIPDISYNADPSTAILIYLSFLGPQRAGYYGIGGTSEGSPQWAGLIADGSQLAGHSLGYINPYLYAIGSSSNYANSYHDITTGNNSSDGITGYSCTTGWDPVTGWGSPQATSLLIHIIQMEQGQSSKK